MIDQVIVNDGTAFWFKSGGYIQVTCTDWSKKLESKGFTDESK